MCYHSILELLNIVTLFTNATCIYLFKLFLSGVQFSLKTTVFFVTRYNLPTYFYKDFQKKLRFSIFQL